MKTKLTQEEKRKEIDLMQTELFNDDSIRRNQKLSNLEVLERMDVHCGNEINEATPTLKHLKFHFGLSTKKINELKK